VNYRQYVHGGTYVCGSPEYPMRGRMYRPGPVPDSDRFEMAPKVGHGPFQTFSEGNDRSPVEQAVSPGYVRAATGRVIPGERMVLNGGG
jgi:hypothetical protein